MEQHTCPSNIILYFWLLRGVLRHDFLLCVAQVTGAKLPSSATRHFKLQTDQASAACLYNTLHPIVGN